MRKLIWSLIFLHSISLSFGQLNSQEDTLFYVIKNGFVCGINRDIAEGYSINQPFNENLHKVQIRYLATNNLMVEYDAYDKKYEKDRRGSFLPIKNGKYEEWYVEGGKRISCNYSENMLNGDFIAYYPNGNLKRMEWWENGIWLDGECYDENGKITDYYAYQEQPEFYGGLTELYKYLGKELKYPKYAEKHRIFGVVYVGFVVDIDGTIKNIKVLNQVDPFLRNEAVRIVSEMPRWKPGRFEGELVQIEYTLPIRFTLN